ncbi:cytochrome P450 3A41-like [Eriocheir sinensis]|uniref:cytochrome P450 3A41-like n=1 Tax=Eriocheir sinensis TaxID=95602 RepID=UPI0021C587A3|nr:cytochrome P450 3A41-like [Eriocheir sinensis]XP_050717043.1 cytochrome P450 3A41-like [Eriocheir sinensis]
MGVETWLLLATLVMLAWLYSRWRLRYWASKGVPSPPALPFIGHLHKSLLIAKTFWREQNENYTKFYSSSMYGHYEFFKPILVTWDTEIIKHVFIKDFDHFTDRRGFDMDTGHYRDEVISEMLSLKRGAEWRSLRAIMSPTFTSGKIKNMFPLVCDKADALVKYSMKQASENPHVDMKRNFGRYTMDTIASCAFGIECNSLVDNDAFTNNVEIFFKPGLVQMIKSLFFLFMPRLFKMFGTSLQPPKMDFFIDTVNQTVAARQAGQKRGDYLDLLLEARENSDNSDSKHVLSDNAIIAQSIIFIIAGFDTTASLLAFSFFLLAKNRDQQERLRDEVRQMVAEHGGITYQGIMEAKLLDACLQETLRLYPPAVSLERRCIQTYKLPGTDVTLQPEDLLQVPIWSLHHDPRLWPDPEAFIPDRFLPENKSDIQPFSHLPFGTGPRNCIAMRFALLEAKVAVAKLLLEAEVEPAPGFKLVLETNIGLLGPKGGMNLVLKPIKEE